MHWKLGDQKRKARTKRIDYARFNLKLIPITRTGKYFTKKIKKEIIAKSSDIAKSC
jgi:hypothetical protein